MLWAKPEEQRVAIEVLGVDTPEGHPLMNPSHLGNATELETLECVLHLLYL